MTSEQFNDLRAMLKRLDEAEERVRLSAGTVLDAFTTRFPDDSKTLAFVEAVKEREAAKSAVQANYTVKR